MTEVCVKLTRGKRDRGSLYSMVSSSDLTPGSLDVWVELPDQIKYDPSLAPFKNRYEQQHGKITNEGDKTIFDKDRNHNTSAIKGVRSETAIVKLLEPKHHNEEDKDLKSNKKKRLHSVLRLVKLTALVAGWLLLTVSLMLNREKTDIVLHTAVMEGQIKEYVLAPSSQRFAVHITLTGPFTSSFGNSSNYLHLWLQGDGETQQNSQKWSIQLPEDDVIDFSPSATESKTLVLEGRGYNASEDMMYRNESDFGSLEGNSKITNEGDKTIFDKDRNHNTSAIKGVRSETAIVKLLEPKHHNEEDKDLKSNKKKRLHSVLRLVKLTALVAGWLLLTVSLMLNREKTDIVLHTAVMEGQIKEYVLAPSSQRFAVHITLTGPFTSSFGNSSNYLHLWLQGDGETQQNSQKWSIQLPEDDVIDFSPSATESKTLVLEGRGYNASEDMMYRNESDFGSLEGNSMNVSLRLSTTSNKTVPLTLSYRLNPLSLQDGLIYATVLLFSLYLLIIFEIVNRTLAALLSSSLSIAVLALSGARPSLPELVSWLDVETLLLLFSMMLLVAILAETGLFDYLAVLAFEVTGGRTWPLINCLCLFTAVFSTFLDNVTTVLLMTPVTIRLCEVMELNPVPVLMCMVIFSNVGGAATPVGDPPNVIIATHPSIVLENINFTSFTLHMGVGILAVAAQTYLQLRFMFRDINKLRHSVPRDIQEKRQEIAVWRRAAASLSSYSRDEDLVRRALEKKVDKLNAALQRREAKGGPSRSDPNFCSTLATMKQKYYIRDKPLLIKSVVCVSFVVLVFFLHAIPELQRLSLGWTALLGALLLLLLAERDDLEPILARVEWTTLLFFAALFVLMEALTKLGLIQWIGNVTESIILQVPKESRLTVALMLILWVSGLASAFVDNIPLTTMMIRVIATLSSPTGLGLPLAPLAWALSFGACLGGNGTLIGASANVVCAGVAEQHGYRFTFLQFFKIGFPVMIGNLIVASIYLLICHCALQWH